MTTPLSPYEWSRRVHSTDPRTDPVLIVIATSPRVLHGSPIVWRNHSAEYLALHGLDPVDPLLVARPPGCGCG